MPFFLPERLPLPSLKSYSIISIILFASSLFHARNVYTRSENDQLEVLDMFGKENFCLWVSFIDILNLGKARGLAKPRVSCVMRLNIDWFWLLFFNAGRSQRHWEHVSHFLKISNNYKKVLLSDNKSNTQKYFQRLMPLYPLKCFTTSGTSLYASKKGRLYVSWKF